MESQILCPLLVAGYRAVSGPGDGYDPRCTCQGTSCAWYVAEQERCAMLALAQSADGGDPDPEPDPDPDPDPEPEPEPTEDAEGDAAES